MINIKYQTNKGKIIEGNSIELLSGKMKKELQGKVNLIITSPPFPLNNKKHVVYYNLFLQYNKISQQNIVEK
jgi:DNA modification methylase